MSSLNEAVLQPVQQHFPSFSIETSIKDKNQQHHQRSLPKGQIAKVDISTAVNVPWRLYKLSTDTAVSILAGSNTGSSGITSNLMRNKNQLLSYCVAALSYARIYSERSWKPNDIDKIVDIGWNINRRAKMKRPMNFEYQTDITDVFYIDSIKFVTLTKASIANGILDREDLASVNDFFNLLLEKGQQSCVVELNKTYFSFWKADDKYFIFQTINFYHKSPKCIQFWSFECVKKYMEKMFVELDAQAEYAFHSVDILKINDHVLSRPEIFTNFFQDHSGKKPKKNVNVNLGNIPHRICLMPRALDTIQTSYENVSECKDVLRCTKSIDRSAKISSTCAAAIVVLRVNKASFWTSDTLSDIIALGSKMYKENLKLKKKGQTEIRVADITQRIEFRSFQCQIESQQMLFGKVESTVANVCNIEQGLSQFFTAHLAGVIDGPNVVAVWKENNYYYMYDAKPRNRYGRKLTKVENAAGESGMSCVTRFQQLIDLVEIYVTNVPHKERQDYYKITHIELKPFLGKHWNQWKVALPGQWCLSGQRCLKAKDELRICVAALLYAEKITMKKWTQDVIDEIASTGGQCPDYSIMKSSLKETKLEIVIKEKTSFVTIKQKIFRYVVNELDKNIEDDLVKGFTMFFESNKHGIFSFSLKKNWKYFSVWKSSSNWFAFGVHVISNEVTGNEKKEDLCGLRFTSQIDMVKSLTANIVIRKNQEFSLSSVNLSEEDQKLDKKKMKNYKPLTVSRGYAGILRIGKNFDLIGCEEDDCKHSYTITSVIAMTLIKDCWSWSNYDVWDILKISQKSFSAQFKELDNFFIKIGSTKIKIKDMETFSYEKENSEAQDEKGISNEMENSRPVFEDFMKSFEEHDYPNGILKSKHLQLGLWKKDGAFFIFDLRDADATGVVTNQQSAKSACPYVAIFDSMRGLLDHIWPNLCDAGNGSYELISFKLKAKIKNSNLKTWYNFSPVSDISNQWMIRSMYGNLQHQYGISSCVIAIAFASSLQPSNWNSSMLDSTLKYGIKLYKKSLKTNSTEIKLNSIANPFIIGCFEFSFTTELFKCGANEANVFENGIVSLFNHSDFGVISSKGYSAAVWKQNSSYFIFDPQLNGMASLSRFPDIALICNHFLSHVRTGMTGVNVFEIYKMSIARNMTKNKECPVDIKAISKLTNRLTPISDATNENTRIFNISALGEDLPTECVLVAACVLGVHKNAEYWTSDLTEEIRSLGTNLLQTIVKKFNLVNQQSNVSIQPDQLQGVYSFDTRTAIRIRTEEFHFDAADVDKQIKIETKDIAITAAPIVNDPVKTTLAKFFELYDNAFLSTTNAALTAWKQNGRFYLFCYQPIDINEHLTNVGEPKGVLLTFLNLDELHTFLKTNFGGGSDSKWLKIRFIEVDFMPLENCSANEQSLLATDDKDVNEVQDVTLANTNNSRLSGPVCRCSSNKEDHMEKHAALCLAAIIMSIMHEVKTWTEKSLSQIEIFGNVLYDDAVIHSHCKHVNFVELPQKLYIEHVEHLWDISDNKTDHDMDEPTLTDVIENGFEKNSSTLCVLIGTHSFSLIEQDQIFYWYDPSGVGDANKEIRSSVCCFSNIQLLVTHILELNNILASPNFSVEFVKNRKL